MMNPRIEASGVPTRHAYTTTVASSDGSFAAEVMSLPNFFDAPGAPEGLDALIEELGVQRGSAVTEQSLEDLLRQIAFETTAARSAGVPVVFEVVQAVVHEPIVVTEQSPAIGRSLLALIGQAPPGYILIVEGRPFLALAYEAGLFVVWFIAGPVRGAREGLREGVQEATRTVSSELFERWLRRRFPRRRGRQE
jgi:hypothetical protein